MPVEILSEISQYLSLLEFVRLTLTSKTVWNASISYEARYRRDVSVQRSVSITTGKPSYFYDLCKHPQPLELIHWKTALKCGYLDVALHILEFYPASLRGDALAETVLLAPRHFEKMQDLIRDRVESSALAILLGLHYYIDRPLTEAVLDECIASPLAMFSAYFEDLDSLSLQFTIIVEKLFEHAPQVLMAILLDQRLSSLAVCNICRLCLFQFSIFKSDEYARLFTIIPLSRCHLSEHGKQLFLAVCENGYLPLYLRLVAEPEFAGTVTNDLYNEGFRLACDSENMDIVNYFVSHNLADLDCAEYLSLVDAHQQDNPTATDL
ncbi:hypothetical protein HDU91_000767 [Kappamyces sp. JEL0680]|nr:hypothetical protein HDU91_000767 [Kappamyces sp. JEL0680]